MVGAGGITGRRANTAITLFDEVFVGEFFVLSVTPFFTHAFVQVLGEGLGESIRQRFGHDRVVVVVVLFEFFDEFLQSVPAGDGERAKVVGGLMVDG